MARRQPNTRVPCAFERQGQNKHRCMLILFCRLCCSAEPKSSDLGRRQRIVCPYPRRPRASVCVPILSHVLLFCPLSAVHWCMPLILRIRVVEFLLKTDSVYPKKFVSLTSGQSALRLLSLFHCGYSLFLKRCNFNLKMNSTRKS